jgi:two-component system chemotaxis response regulator CheY
MKAPAVNLRDLVILVADTNSFGRRVIHGILRGFGATRVLLAETPFELYQLLSNQKIDMLVCDIQFPPQGGIMVTRNIRGNTKNENRTLPILLTAGFPNGSLIRHARDAGANTVIAKPMSANSLYDRLCWIAFNPRPFVDTATYFGPDRRFKIEGYPGGIGRRKEDKQVEVLQEAGPTLAQNDIDSLFNAAKAGNT